MASWSSVSIRLQATIAAAVTLVFGLGTRAVLAGWLAKYLGVALWATLVYFLILFVAPRTTTRRAFILCTAISFAVELFQLTPIPMALYGIHPFFALVLGTTFSAADLPAYVVGAALGALTQSRGFRAPPHAVEAPRSRS